MPDPSPEPGRDPPVPGRGACGGEPLDRFLDADPDNSSNLSRASAGSARFSFDPILPSGDSSMSRASDMFDRLDPSCDPDSLESGEPGGKPSMFWLMGAEHAR